jgi:osmotically-inducible protein OsmY
VAGVIDRIQTLSPTGRIEPSGSHDAGEIFSLHVQGLTESDRTLAQRILQGLRTDTALTSLLPVVDIHVADGRVNLRGTVQGEEQRRTIVSAVRRAAGADNVVDEIRVVEAR